MTEWESPLVKYLHQSLRRESGRRRPELGVTFVWCAEHDRAVDTCRRLAETDYGQPAFDNCQWITEAERLDTVADDV